MRFKLLAGICIEQSKRVREQGSQDHYTDQGQAHNADLKMILMSGPGYW